MPQSLLFDIKRYSINEGPGIRLTIFFKGCPLGCRWCHNPESISSTPQKMYTAAKCIGCRACIEVCTQQACRMTADGIVTDLLYCDACGCCAEVCPSRASELSGRRYTQAELMGIIEKEIPFFDQSGGGVTFSGGEPLAHLQPLLGLLQGCGDRGLHRCIDTSGFAPWESLEQVTRQAELFLFDLKLLDAARHKEWTGVDNRLILENLQRLAATGADIRIRVPLISGINTDSENIEALGTLVAGLPGGARPLDLLPYHGIAAHKYAKLNQSYNETGLLAPEEGDIDAIRQQLQKFGLLVSVGG
ncbi:glycyl-radical enzyme activating protein [Geopsychrobacter electrodiphilus]|uniref:glycyl-radical enzyme activating protein n=1 Tax=Geopsychrobacter electrodiphilus TaxID=225196 RepID=UPI00037B1727|nr:glycyl-radical enzyme activating protein [Geopsychrobacter electrodiphilus]